MKNPDSFVLDSLDLDIEEQLYLKEHCFNCPMNELVVTNDDFGNCLDVYYYCKKYSLDCFSCRNMCIGAVGSQLSLFDYL